MSVNKKATMTVSDASKDPMIGRQLGDYRLTSVLATGGMAKIYRAMDYQLQRQAAVKVLSQEDIDLDKTLTKRFQREARAIAALEHDNIITIYQYGEQDGVYFLAMKLIKGKDLAQELKRLKRAGQRMDVRRALHIMEQVASALDYAHAAGVVHRDIKPSNILLDENDRAILTDFGLVLRASSETTLGTAFGTPRYIAPEQAISSNKAVPQSDIYSLGIILYEVLCGDTPFNGESPMEIALSHISDAPPAPRSKNPDIPPAVERELLKALDKEPEKRHRSATAFIQAVKKGYGVTTLEVPVIAPVEPPPAPPPAAVPPPAPRATKERGRLSRKPVLLVATLVGLLVIVGALIALGGGGGSGSIPGAPITLIYSDSTFAMLNGGDYTLEVATLKFIRGEDDAADDYYGDRIKRDVLPPGACARIVLMERQVSAPPGCGAEHSLEQLADPTRFFWRTETKNGSAVSSFSVVYQGRVLVTCPTVPRGGNSECRFNWPVAPTPTPSTN
ncbi:MAG: serine/threonine protein kinase [Chloroflexi bacterium]|nr:serine/threonine protein kinase [Chloroflexota bacterium]